MLPLAQLAAARGAFKRDAFTEDRLGALALGYTYDPVAADAGLDPMLRRARPDHRSAPSAGLRCSNYVLKLWSEHLNGSLSTLIAHTHRPAPRSPAGPEWRQIVLVREKEPPGGARFIVWIGHHAKRCPSCGNGSSQ